uniref:Arrestin C-terminal-like domain-containing protein n=1 Tax=Monopterus albus TaxID=43700 RepID=A0A3Q3J1Z5_MONAL
MNKYHSVETGVCTCSRCSLSPSNQMTTGETLSIVAKICNSSSKKVTPKYSMMQKTVYRASGSTNKSEKSICKIVGNTISSNSEDSVSCQLKIPVDVSYIKNCTFNVRCSSRRLKLNSTAEKFIKCYDVF